MVDVLTKKQRSYNMSRVKSKNTKPEILLRKLLIKHGIKGYRIHYDIPGKPDIALTKYRLAIFIDGCFWHNCPICFVKPETRTEFWMKKILGNVKRDKLVNKQLGKKGWKVLRFWEHEIRKYPERIVLKIIKQLKKQVKLSAH